MHSSWDRYGERNDATKAGSGVGILAALSVQPEARSGRKESVSARLARSEDWVAGLYLHRGALSHAEAERSGNYEAAPGTRAGSSATSLATVPADGSDE